jgi:iduronate 2-sulfatase
MHRTLYTLALLLFTGLGPSADRPNVLFLISDDLNNYLGCYGDEKAKTPNIDALAARGVRFDKAYCAFPLCGPSRNSMLTGLYPNSTGILTNSLIFRQTIPSAISLPQAFRLDGYLAGRIGKLYHYNVPNSIGTNGHDDPGSWELELNPAGVDRIDEGPIFTLTPGQYGGTLSWYASPKSDEFHTDAMLAKDAEWVLERCAKEKDRPFFLAVGFYRPHTPYVAPEKPYFGYYPTETMRPYQKVTDNPEDVPAAALGSYKKEQDQLTDELHRQCAQAYYASISFLDTQVGRVVASLDRLGLAENTIIVFTSDHGYHMGEHGLYQKQSLFEGSARVPLLIVAPGKTKGGVVNEPVSQVDLYPTLTELAGVKAPGNLQGQSLVPMLLDPAAKGRGWALTQVARGGGLKPKAAAAKGAGAGAKRFFGYSLRTDRWRYTEWDEGREGAELYDHEADPGELVNLAKKPEHAATVAELSKTLQEAAKKTFPKDGVTPPVSEGPMWAPNLFKP